MSSTEEVRILKQTYLREAILEAGYSPEKFIEYLQTVKKKSVDIDKWSLDELKQEVANYKKYYSMEEPPIENMDPTLSPSNNKKAVQRTNSKEIIKEKAKENGKATILRFKSTKITESPLKIIKIDEEVKINKIQTDFAATKKSVPNKHGKLSATVKE